MALPILRGYTRVQPTFSFTRLFLTEGRPFITPAVRPYSSDGGEQNQKPKMAVLGIQNPFAWIRNRIQYFLIRVHFDNEFNVKEFTEGTKQAFVYVSGLLSQCKFDALEGLVAKDLIGQLKEKCSLLPLSYKDALSVKSDEIVYTMSRDVRIHQSDDRVFVSVLMHFWYFSNADLPDEKVEGSYIFNMASDTEKFAKKKMLFANYEFQKEFTKGAPPDWTITRIEHSKLLN